MGWGQWLPVCRQVRPKAAGTRGAEVIVQQRQGALGSGAAQPGLGPTLQRISRPGNRCLYRAEVGVGLGFWCPLFTQNKSTKEQAEGLLRCRP